SATTFESGRLNTMRRQAEITSSGDSRQTPPIVFRAATCRRLISHPFTSYPAARNRPVRAVPMRPMPIKPICSRVRPLFECLGFMLAWALCTAFIVQVVLKIEAISSFILACDDGSNHGLKVVHL